MNPIVTKVPLTAHSRTNSNGVAGTPHVLVDEDDDDIAGYQEEIYTEEDEEEEEELVLNK